MPLSGAEYIERDAEEILAFLAAEMRAEFGEDIDLTESSAFRTFAKAVAETDEEYIETALKEVHESSILDDAEDEQLEKLVAILGVTRREATRATGVIEFSHSGIVTSEYKIYNGTIVQTDSNDPIEYETTELVTLSPFDNFEAGQLSANYAGSTSSFNVVDDNTGPSAYNGTYKLEGPATADVKVFNDRGAAERGSKQKFTNYLNANTIAGNLFGVVDSDNYYRVKLDSSNGTHAIESVVNGTETTLKSRSVTIPTGAWIENEIRWEGENRGRIISVVYDETGSVVDELEVTGEDAIAKGGWGYESLDGTDTKYWDISGQVAVQSDARARSSGPEGNIAANTLTVMPSPPSGVDAVTNPWAMGDDDHQLTNTVNFTTGLPREDDDALRERTKLSKGLRGKGTGPALIGNISELPGAQSVNVYENDDNATDADGRPAFSFEVVYYGTDPQDEVAETIFETKGFTAQDVGGYIGTEQTYTYKASNGQTFDVSWSEPTEVGVDMTLEVVVNDEFIGEDELRDAIVGYVGGTLSDGTTELGTGAGEDLYVDQIEDVVTGPDDTGVIGIASYSFTPSVTTDSNGLEVVSIADGETATTNAQDGSISLTITRV